MVVTNAQEVEVRGAHPSKTAMDGAVAPVGDARVGHPAIMNEA